MRAAPRIEGPGGTGRYVYRASRIDGKAPVRQWVWDRETMPRRAPFTGATVGEWRTEARLPGGGRLGRHAYKDLPGRDESPIRRATGTIQQQRAAVESGAAHITSTSYRGMKGDFRRVRGKWVSKTKSDHSRRLVGTLDTIPSTAR